MRRFEVRNYKLVYFGVAIAETFIKSASVYTRFLKDNAHPPSETKLW